MTDFPLTAAGTHDDPTWGESGGPFSIPPNVATGFGADALPSNTVNYEWQHIARWVRAIRDRMVWSNAGLYTTFLFPGSGTWTIGGATLDSSIGPCWAMVDANDDGGIGVQFTVPVGTPHTFTASKDTYVNLDETGAVEYQEVNIGDPAPSPSAGYVAIWKIVTSVTELVSATVLVFEVPVFVSLAGLSIATTGNAEIGGDLDVVGATTLGGTLGVTGATTLEDTLDVSGVTIVDNTFTVDNQNPAYLTGNVACGTTSGDAFTCNATAQFNANATFSGELKAEGNTTLGNAGTDTCTVNAVMTFNTSIAGGVTIVTTVAAATALNLTSATGYGLVINVDATSPVRAPIYVTPQDADPSSPSGSGGDLMFNNGRGPLGVWRCTTGLGTWESVHSSAKGQIAAVGAAASSTLTSGSSIDLSSVTIQPEETGTLIIEVTGYLEWSADAASTTIQIRDHTLGATINGGGTGVLEYPIVGAIGRGHSFVAKIPYALPSVASRTFKVRLTAASGTTTYTDVTVEVRGVY